MQSGAAYLLSDEERAVPEVTPSIERAVLDMLLNRYSDTSIHSEINRSSLLDGCMVSRQWTDALIEAVRSKYDVEDEAEAFDGSEESDGDCADEDEDFEEAS